MASKLFMPFISKLFYIFKIENCLHFKNVKYTKYKTQLKNSVNCSALQCLLHRDTISCYVPHWREEEKDTAQQNLKGREGEPLPNTHVYMVQLIKSHNQTGRDIRGFDKFICVNVRVFKKKSNLLIFLTLPCQGGGGVIGAQHHTVLAPSRKTKRSG